MKFKRIIAIAALAPLALLAGCGGTPPLSFTSNWYADTTTTNITGTDETLEYEVKFKGTGGDYTLSYDVGSFVTTLKDVNYADANGNTTLAYLYRTELRLTGRYALRGVQGEDFEDYMITEVYFRPAAEGLTPLESKKTVRATVPVGTPVDGALSVTHEYELGVVYAADLSNVECTLKTTLPEASEKTESVKPDVNGTFLDNEQIAFALRGLSLSAAATFTTLDPQTRRSVSVNIGAPTTVSEHFNFELNGQTVDEDIATVQYPLSYQASQPGPGRTFVYAGVTDAHNNRFRSVLLRFENTVMQSMGTVQYTLKRATFNMK